MNVTLFGNRDFTDDQVKMKLLAWTLNQCPYEKEKFRQRQTHTGRMSCEGEIRDQSATSIGKDASDCQQATRS